MGNTFPPAILALTSDKEIERMVGVLTRGIDSDKEYDQQHKPYWKQERTAMQKELRFRGRHHFRVNKYGRKVAIS